MVSLPPFEYPVHQTSLTQTDTKHASIASICDVTQMGHQLASAASTLRELRLIGPQSSVARGQSTLEEDVSAEKCIQIFFCLDAWYSLQQGVSPVG